MSLKKAMGMSEEKVSIHTSQMKLLLDMLSLVTPTKA
jgi:hypothetical protein